MMTQNIKNGDCTPRLRFPEFEGSTWYQIKLNELCHLKAGSLISSSSIKDHKSKDLYPCYGGNGLRGFTNQFNYDGEFPLIGRQGEFCGNIKLAHGKFYATEHAIVASVKEKNFIKFIYYLLENSKLNKIATGQAQPGLSVTLLNKFITAIPQIKEQQKIADCLTSLDDLITAHEQKAEALRQYKKGLMQRLLPAEGETTPRWRFPEFREAGEWEPKVISDVCSVSTGKSNTQDKIVTGEYPFYVRSSTIEKSKKYLYDEEAVLTVGDGVGTGKVYHYVNGKYDLHQRCYRLYNFKNILGKFVFYFFSTHFYNRVSRMTAKNSVDSVRMSMITEMPLFLPPLPEQQKIADCLSALDERIAAEEAKIAALREHKKGVMQRLFPQAM